MIIEAPKWRQNLEGTALQRPLCSKHGGNPCFGGAARCAPCVSANTQCDVHLKSIEQWRREYKEGKEFVKHPNCTNCWLCKKVRKAPCPLPAMADMRKGLPDKDERTPRATRTAKASGSTGMKMRARGRSRGGLAALSASSGGKRKLEFELVMPPLKKARSIEVVSLDVPWGHSFGYWRRARVGRWSRVERRW